MTEKIYMNWADFENDIKIFSKHIETFKDENTVILALKRGAFATSATLSNRLDIPISTVAFQTRDGNDIRPDFLESHMLDKNTKVIIPDDIFDTGKTVKTVIDELNVRFGIDSENILCLFHYYTDNLNHLSDSNILKLAVGIRHNQNRWVVMPWE